MRLGVVIILVYCSLSAVAGSASGNAITDYAVFGKAGVVLGEDIWVGGMVGSNADIIIKQGADVLFGVAGGGSLNPLSGSFVGTGAVIGTSTNPVEVIVNGDFQIDGTVWGDVHAGGNVLLRDGGKIRKVAGAAGNVIAAGNVEMRSGSRVEGDVTLNGTLTKLGTASIWGSVNYGSASPKTYTGPTLPAATLFSAGGTNYTTTSGATLTLAPGSYGMLDLGQNNDLYLSSGTYYFTAIDMRSGLDLFLDLTGGGINILVTGDVYFGERMDVKVKTDPLGTYVDLDSLSAAQKAYAAIVYLETHRSWTLRQGSDWFGTVYAPYDIVTVEYDVYSGESTDLIGALYSGGQVYLRQGAHLEFVPSEYWPHEPHDGYIPEPTTLALVGVGIAAAVLQKRRQRA